MESFSKIFETFHFFQPAYAYDPTRDLAPVAAEVPAGERGITEGDRGRIPRQGGNDAGGDLQSWAKERELAPPPPAARGNQEAGFTQPRALLSCFTARNYVS